MGGWIASGGVVEQEVVAPPPTLPRPLAPSDGESEVGVSNTELPSPRQIVPKVCQADDIEHTLDKGLWVGTGAMRRGWKIFVNMHLSFLLQVGQGTDPSGSGPVDGVHPNMPEVSGTPP